MSLTVKVVEARCLEGFTSGNPDGKLPVSVAERRIFPSGKEVEKLRGGVLRFAARVWPKIDVTSAEKVPFPDRGWIGGVEAGESGITPNRDV
jgi:hypothetical protein